MSYPYLGDIINAALGTQWQIPVPTFGLFVAAGLLVGVYVSKKEVERLVALGLLAQASVRSRHVNSQHQVPAADIVFDLGVFSTLFGLVGARLFHVLEYPRHYLSHPAEIVFSQGGFSIYGGLIFGLIAGLVFVRRRQLALLPMLDAVAPALMLAYAIGRLGCQVAGDGDWGTAANLALKPDWVPLWLWAQQYPNNIVGVVIPAPGVYPTPIYESIMAFGIFVFLMFIRKRGYPVGFVFSAYLLLNGLERFAIEKIRVNADYHVLGLHFTQAELIAVLLVLLGLFGIFKTTTNRATPKILFSAFAVLTLSACSL